MFRPDSKMLTPPVVGDRHYQIAQAVRQTLANYEELKDIIAIAFAKVYGICSELKMLF